MVFRVEMDGESIACSSARCISRLLQLGWVLADAAQGLELERALALEETEEDEAAPARLHALAAR
jgi:hypothetical protein